MNCRGMCPSAGIADEIWLLLLDLAFNHAREHFEATVAEFSLAPAQAIALHELEPDRAISMRELASRLNCDPSNITGLTDRLEARGLVERKSEQGDRRVKSLVLTAAGRELRGRLARRLYQTPACLGRLAADDQQRLQSLLQQVIHEMSRLRPKDG